MRIGTCQAEPTGPDALGTLRDELQRAADDGFSSAWMSNIFGLDALTALAVAGSQVPGIGLGTAVVPTYPRHPAVLAQQTLTTATAVGGRLVLGIGLSHKIVIDDMYGYSFDRPARHMSEYLSILLPLLDGQPASFTGETMRAAIGLSTPRPGRVPVLLAALGPQMLRLAGEAADGACLNWASPEQIGWSREQVAAGATKAGRDPAASTLSMYIRVCVDEDVAAARRAFAEQVLGYSLVRPGADPTLAYRGHFGRMGFETALRDLEASRDAGAPMAELCDAVPEDLLAAVGYYGTAAGAAARFAELSVGLDETIVRVVTARKTLDAVRDAMQALTPEKIRAAAGAA